MNSIKAVFAGVLGLVLSGAATPTATIVPAYAVYARPGQMVMIAPGRRLNLRCSGKGPVTVLFESGLGFPSYSWRKVQPAVARRTRACSYDRAGLGFSDPGPLPRTAGAIADDLAALIKAAGLRPPFVLVANSMGSQSVRLFAFRHPTWIGGIVLVDPYVEGQLASYAAVNSTIIDDDRKARVDELKCLKLLRRRLLTAPQAETRGCIAERDPQFPTVLMRVVRQQRLKSSTADTVYSEGEHLDALSSAQVVRETRPLGTIPLVVLTAGENFSDSPDAWRTALRERQAALHRSLAALSLQGRVEVVTGASHVIQSSRPADVIDAIVGVIERVETSRKES